jgi:hypothetical protein
MCVERKGQRERERERKVIHSLAEEDDREDKVRC